MATIICPYVFPEEIAGLKDSLWELDTIFEQDTSKIGSDMMYQKLCVESKEAVCLVVLENLKRTNSS